MGRGGNGLWFMVDGDVGVRGSVFGEEGVVDFWGGCLSEGRGSVFGVRDGIFPEP